MLRRSLTASAEPEAQGQLLLDHTAAIRRMPGFGDAAIIFIPESNLAFEGIHQANLLKRVGVRNVVLMTEDDNRVGVRTNAPLKAAMKMAFEEKLKKGHVRLHKDFLVVHEGSDRTEVLQQMREELDNYSVIYTERKSADSLFEGPKVRICGKLGFGFDDLVICLQLNLIMKRRFFQSVNYLNYR